MRAPYKRAKRAPRIVPGPRASDRPHGRADTTWRVELEVRPAPRSSTRISAARQRERRPRLDAALDLAGVYDGAGLGLTELAASATFVDLAATLRKARAPWDLRLYHGAEIVAQKSNSARPRAERKRAA